MTFRLLLKRLLKKHFPSVRAFAQALDIDPSHLSRAMGSDGQPFDVKGCLRLARVTGTNPGEVLRAAGKAEIADLIEQLYGPTQLQLSPEQQQILAALDAVPDPLVRQAVITVVRSAGAATKTGGSSGSAGNEGGPGGGTLPPPKEPDYKMGDVFTRRLRNGGR